VARQPPQPGPRAVGEEEHDVGDREQQRDALERRPERGHEQRGAQQREVCPQHDPCAVHVEKRRDREQGQQMRGLTLAAAHELEPGAHDRQVGDARRRDREREQPDRQRGQRADQEPDDAEERDHRVRLHLDRQRPQREVHGALRVGREHAGQVERDVVQRAARHDREHVVDRVGERLGAGQVARGREHADQRAEHEGAHRHAHHECRDDAQEALDRERAQARLREPAAGDQEAADGEEDLDAERPERPVADARLGAARHHEGVRDEYQRRRRETEHVEAVVPVPGAVCEGQARNRLL
jgi:hypothetical protein